MKIGLTSISMLNNISNHYYVAFRYKTPLQP
jgi:hypothetical protein